MPVTDIMVPPISEQPPLSPGTDLPASAKSRAVMQGAVALVAGLAVLVLSGAALTGLWSIIGGVVGAAAALAGILLLVQATWRRPVAVGFWLAAIWLAGLTVFAIVAPLLPLPEGLDPAKALNATALALPKLFSGHPFGTDTQALDVMTGLVYGARVSLTVAVGGVLIGSVIGGLIGIVAGYLRGKIDAAVGFIIDVILSFPALILLLALVTVLQPSVINVTLALGFLSIPGYARLARANTLTVAQREFITAARTIGTSRWRIMRREILPNVAPSLLAYSFIVVGFLIVAEASLSFLGLGIKRPHPTWGNLIAQGQPYLTTHSYLVFAPAVALFLTVISMNVIGQRLQKKWGL